MKKLFFIFFAFLTGYLAGAYRYPALIVLFIMEIVLFIVSFLLPRYFKRKLSIEALKYSDSAQKGGLLQIYMKTGNKGRLPISRFKVRLRYRYQKDAKGEKKWIYGGSDCGEQTLHFQMMASYCGIVYLQFDRLKIYDYLSLFSVSKKIMEKKEIVIFPQERALNIQMQSLCNQEMNPSGQQVRGSGVSAHDEVKQLREYRSGDSKRHIHWNQSARMDELWVKEYEEETNNRVELLLDFANIEEAPIAQLDAYYELLSALLFGLLKNSLTVSVNWHDRRLNMLTNAEVCNAAQCRELLFQIYQMEKRTPFDFYKKAALEADFMVQGNVIKLDLGLRLYWNQSVIFQFNKEQLNYQLAYMSFVI